MLRFTFLILVIMSLIGCVETKPPKPPERPYPKEPYYKQVMRNWRGYPLEHLVRKWGTPDKTYSTNKIKFVIYNKPLRYEDPSVTWTSYWQTAYCTYTFELSRKKDIILRAKGEGWACPLYEDEIDNGIVFGKTRPRCSKGPSWWQCKR